MTLQPITESEHSQTLMLNITELKLAADSGDTTAMLLVAAHEEWTERNLVAARIRLRRAAATGEAEAQFACGDFLYFYGASDEESAEGLRLIHAAAEQGLLEAQLYLARHYESECGKDNAFQAYRWYSCAARQGSCEAELGLGICYLKGFGVKHNHLLARHYMKCAYEHSCGRLGFTMELYGLLSYMKKGTAPRPLRPSEYFAA